MQQMTANHFNTDNNKTANLVSDVSSEYLALMRMDLRSASNIIRCSLVASPPSGRPQCCYAQAQLMNIHKSMYTRTYMYIYGSREGTHKIKNVTRAGTRAQDL